MSHPYLIQTWNQPQGVGYGWATCSPKAKGARWFVFRKKPDPRDRLNGRDFPTRAAALSAIERAVGQK